MSKSLFQKTFDKVYLALKEQGKPAVAPDMGCTYRAYDKETHSTLKCAIGHLISDKDYKKSFESLAIGYLISDKKILPEFNSGKGIAFIERLQDCHDFAHFGRQNKSGLLSSTWFKDFSSRMVDLANEYKLNTFVMN